MIPKVSQSISCAQQQMQSWSRTDLAHRVKEPGSQKTRTTFMGIILGCCKESQFMFPNTPFLSKKSWNLQIEERCQKCCFSRTLRIYGGDFGYQGVLSFIPWWSGGWKMGRGYGGLGYPRFLLHQNFKITSFWVKIRTLQTNPSVTNLIKYQSQLT